MQLPVATPVAPPGPMQAPRPDPGARGFQVDARELVNAQHPAQINARGFVAEAGAGYGPAITAAGEQGAKLYEAHVDSVTKEQVLNADAALDTARLTIAAKLAGEPNTLKWQQIASEEAAAQQQAVLSDPNLTPAAKAHITGMYNRWQQTEVAQVGLQAAQAQSKRTAQALVGKAVDQQRNGDFTGADETLKYGGETNILDPEFTSKSRKANAEMAEAAKDEAQLKSGYRAAKADPWALKEKLPELPDGMKVSTYDRIIAEADQQIRVKQGEIVDSFYGAMEIGAEPGATAGVKNADEAKDWLNKYGAHLTDREKSQLMTGFHTYTNQNARQAAINNAPREASRLYTEVQDLDPKRNSVEEYVALKNRIGMLPDDTNMRSVLNKMVDAKWQNKTIPPDKSVVSWGEAQLNSKLRGQVFGAYLVPKMGVGASGKTYEIEDTHGNKEMVRDEQKYQEALTKKALVGGQFKQYLIDHPDIADGFATGDPAAVEEANKQLNLIIGMSPLTRYIDVVRQAMEPFTKMPITPAAPPPAKPDAPAAAPDVRPPRPELAPDEPAPEDGNILLKNPEEKRTAGMTRTGSSIADSITKTPVLDARTEKNIKTLHADVQPHAAAVVDLFNQHMPEGYEVRIIDAARTADQQAEIYAQGRTKPGKIVTHAPPGHSKHESGRAFDIGIFKNGKYLEESPLYAQLGPIGETVGFEWGGRWKGKQMDEPHFQMPSRKS